MESAAIVLLLVLIGILLAKSLRKKPPGHRGSVQETSRPRRLAKSCPLCGSGLEPGERVRSIVYPAEGDTLAEIYGCPHCDGESATQQRTCPFCKKLSTTLRSIEFASASAFAIFAWLLRNLLTAEWPRLSM